MHQGQAHGDPTGRAGGVVTANPGKLSHRRNCTRPDPQVSVDARGTRRTCLNCHRYVFTHAEAPPLSPLTTAQARDLATELIRDLTPHAGNPEAVRKVLLQWLDIEDTARMSMACMAAVQIVFSDCLSRVTEVPPGALTLEPPTERTHAYE